MTDSYTQDFIDEVKGALNSGSSGGGTIDQTARDDISKHASDSEIHVTTVEKASWNGKAELSDIPTSLPANGGNADTVDGKHANEFYPAKAANIMGGDYDTLVNNGIYEIQGSATTPSTNAPDGNNISSNFYVQVFRHSANWITQIATSVRGDRKQYIRSKENGVWNAWQRISAGNADTLDGLHASDIQINSVSDTAGIVTLDGLQGGVPFSDIVVSGENHINLTDYTAFPNTIVSTAVGGSDSLTVSYSDSTARSWTDVIYKTPVKPNTDYHLKFTADNATGFTGCMVRQSDKSEFSPSVSKFGGSDFNISFNSGDNDIVYIYFYSNASHTEMTEASVTYHNIMLSEDENAEYVPEIIGQEIALTTCGKNLIPYPYYHSDMTVHGITISDNGDGSITVNGTATDNVVFYFAVRTTGKMNLPNGEYFVSGCPKNSDLRIDISYTNDSGTASELVRDSGNGAGFAMPYSAPLSVGLVIFSGKTYNHITVRPQLERGDNATEYELYSGSTTTIAPDSNPYIVPNNIRQQDGVNNVSVSAGEVSVTGVKRNAAVKKIWDNKADLSDIPIDVVSNTAEMATLDGLQGGVPFSSVTVIGKNLISYPYINTTKTINGITFTDNGDGSITASGTATGSADFYISTNLRLNTGKYVLSGCPEGGSNAGYKLQAYGDTLFNTGFGIMDIGNGAPFEALEAFNITRLMIRFAAGTTADGLVFKPQLERGEAATEYERSIIGQEITLTACGKNLADLSGVDGKLISGISFAYDNGNVVLNGTATAQIYLGIKIHLSAGTYTISGGTDKNARLVLRNKSWLNIADAIAGATATVASDDYYVHIAISSGTVCDNVVIQPQLERGAVATEYEPYSGSVTTITPDSNPYIIPNSIRQQDGINNVSVSAGEVSVTGVKKNAAIKKIWDNKADLSDIHIDTMSDTAGIVTLDGLQGGVPFSEITLSGDIINQEITLRAGGENLLTFNSHNETETISGVTFARLPDGTITANGTSTGIVQYLSDTVEMSDGNTYTLTGCPAGGSGEGYSITNQATANITDMGSGKTFTYDAETFGVARFKIRISAGYTCNNVVFRPVLCSGAAVITKITPNSVPYIITDDIRQRDGINTISVSAGNVTVTGVRNNMAVKRIWDKLDELATAIIVSNGETTE